MKWVINYRDPDRERKEQIKKKSNAILRRLDENERKDGGKGGRLDKLIMSSYEKTILTEVVAPEDIHISFQGAPFSRMRGRRLNWKVVALLGQSLIRGIVCRYWRLGAHNRGIERICHLPTHYVSYLSAPR